SARMHLEGRSSRPLTMTSQLPKSTKVLAVRKALQQTKPVYHDAILEERPIAPLKEDQVLVKIGAVAFNHRDVWIRQGQYPGIAFGSVFGSDGAGTVVAAAESDDPLLHKRVFLVPMRGWKQDPEAPESPFAILGGGSAVPIGTFAQYVAVERDQLIITPDHLDDEHAAAWPLGAVTAWRASVVNAHVQKGDNVLITGIGGGVALLALQICVARGANVYVTSGNKDKIARAVTLGAKAGVNYKDDNWPAQLEQILKRDSANSGGAQTAQLSAVIDSAGGDIMGQTSKIIKSGGRVVVYGMTASPKVTFTMREVLKNQKLIGSTMGSHKDLIDATAFLAEHRIVPVVSHVLDGLEAAEDGFELIRRGEQFGKIVVRVRHDTPAAKL
ncbi:putative zinc-type alcohol dehydrogenase-like protein YogA, partial [Grifola frondosa]